MVWWKAVRDFGLFSDGPKEEQMAKKHPVVFTVRDGPKPVLDGDGSMNLLLPLPLSIKPMTEITFDLGLSCDHVIQIFEAKARRSSGLVLIPNSWIHDAGQTVKLTVQNQSMSPILLEAGDIIARASVLDNSNVVIV